MSSDDDYMSAAFLNDSVAPPTSLLSASKRRKLKPSQENTDRKSKLLSRLDHTLEQGLSTEIPSDNVGFKLLSKMGFKKGGTLGLSEGIAEPIPIVFKNDKQGLGNAKKSIIVAGSKNIKSQMTPAEIDPTEFRNKISSKYEDKQIKDDVKNARKVIEQMDLANDKPSNELWPTRRDQNELEDESEFDLLIPEMQLKQTILYLRSVYRYCIYCGCKFDTEKEMDYECPGELREDHE